MRSVLSFVTRGPVFAILASLVLVFLVPIFPLNGVVIALATLRFGAGNGLRVLLGTLAGMVVASLLTGYGAAPAGAPGQGVLPGAGPIVLFAALNWVPLWLTSWALGLYRSQAVVALMSAGFGALVVVAVHVLTDTPEDFWRSAIERLQIGSLRASETPEMVERFEMFADALAPLMTQIAGAGAGMLCALTVLAARWGHAIVDNPGGFGREFRAMQIGNTGRVAVLAVVAAALVLDGQIGRFFSDLLGPCLLLLFLQGLAILHALILGRRSRIALLACLYVTVFVVPAAGPLVASIGLADGWVDLRKRFGRPEPGAAKGGQHGARRDEDGPDEPG